MAFTFFKVPGKKVKLTFEFGDYTCITTAQESNFLTISKGFYHVFIRFTLIRQKKTNILYRKNTFGRQKEKKEDALLKAEQALETSYKPG
jgi:hypothetical protein